MPLEHGFLFEEAMFKGTYYVACAADQIAVSDGSIVGSIGVVRQSIGLVEVIKKIGVERRVLTVGASKSLGDPFLEETEEDKRKMLFLMRNIFNGFKVAVEKSRGDKLQAEVAASIQSELQVAYCDEETKLTT